MKNTPVEKRSRRTKSVTLTGRRQRVAVTCQHCGANKTLEIRTAKRRRKLFGATQVVTGK